MPSIIFQFLETYRLLQAVCNPQNNERQEMKDKQVLISKRQGVQILSLFL